MESSGLATKRDLNELETRFDKRLNQMDRVREVARREHAAQHKDIYDHVDRRSDRIEAKIDEWRKEQNGRIGRLETWRIKIEAILGVFSKGIRNRTLLAIVLVLVVIGGYLWMQTRQTLCELRDSNVHRLELAYESGKITELYYKTQLGALKQIQC